MSDFLFSPTLCQDLKLVLITAKLSFQFSQRVEKGPQWKVMLPSVSQIRITFLDEEGKFHHVTLYIQKLLNT